jgi:hypothetical protein
MSILSAAEVRFIVKRGLQSLSRSLLRDLAGKPDARERALDIATDVVVARFDGMEVAQPEQGERFDFGQMKKG